MRCTASRQSLAVFLPGTGATGAFSFSRSAFTYRLRQQKVGLPAVEVDVSSVLKPALLSEQCGGCGEQQRRAGLEEVLWARGERGVRGGQWCPSRERGVQDGLPGERDMEQGRVYTRGGTGQRTRKGVCRGSVFSTRGACPGQENWQGVEWDLEGRGGRRQGCWHGEFSCCGDKERWEKVLSKQLLHSEFAGRVPNLQ